MRLLPRAFKSLLLLACILLEFAFAQTDNPQAVDTPDMQQILPLEQDGQAVQNLEQASASIVQNKPLINQEMRIGFVNFRRIMASNPQLLSIRETLAREFQTQQRDLELAQTELANLEQKVASQAENVEELTQQLIAKRREFVRQQAAFQDDYNVRRNEELAKLQAMVLEEIVSLAKAEGFDVILNDNGVLYVSEAADLTQLVIERLMKRGVQSATQEQKQKD